MAKATGRIALPSPLASSYRRAEHVAALLSVSPWPADLEYCRRRLLPPICKLVEDMAGRRPYCPLSATEVVAHELILQLFRNADRYYARRQGASWAGWLVVNVDTLLDRRISPAGFGSSLALYTASSPGYDPGLYVNAARLRCAVRQAIAQLDPFSQRCVRLRYGFWPAHSPWRCERIATVLHSTLGDVTATLDAAHRSLKSELRSEFITSGFP
jgi:hypothetical protein